MTNAEKFFKLYHADAALREELEQALAVYPGSLEIREAVVEDVLLPVARRLGLPFSVEELRTYETEKKLRSAKADVQQTEDEIEEPEEFWLIGYGWEWDETQIKDIR